MEALAVALPGFACAGTMALMTVIITRRQSNLGRGGTRVADHRRGVVGYEEVIRLRDELQRLRAEHDRRQQAPDEHTATSPMHGRPVSQGRRRWASAGSVAEWRRRQAT